MLAKTMTLKHAQQVAGKVSNNNTKMPGSTFAMTTSKCIAGAKIANSPIAWANAIAFQINLYAMQSGIHYHRWFDAGDLQSVEMLHAINLVCEQTPNIQHWLPTREAAMIDEYAIKYGKWLAPNLTVRVSSVMVDDKPIMRWAQTSTVHKEKVPNGSWVCPARQQGNACGECRACWDRTVPNVSYPLH